jgi:hypothetical protein
MSRSSIPSLALVDRHPRTKKAAPGVPGAAFFVSALIQRCLGSFDCVDRAAVNTSTTVRAGSCIDHVLVALLTNGINRASVCTGSAIDTLVINCVGHGTYLLFKEFCSEKLWGVYSINSTVSSAISVLIPLKKLAIYHPIP